MQGYAAIPTEGGLTLGTLPIASGDISSGEIASGAVQGFFGATRHIASGTVGVFDFGSGAVIVGTVGSGAIQSGNIASGQVGFGHLADSSVLSGTIGSGVVSQFKLASGAVNSGQINIGGTPNGTNFFRSDFTWAAAGSVLASGDVGSGKIASGAIQGFFGVTRHVASGTLGVFDFGSGAVIAGTVGSGAILSGNVASGQIGQFHHASGSVTSGHVGNAAVVSGSIASGSIGQFHLSSGTVNSGHIASGAVNAVNIVSGSIGSILIADGAVQSGDIAAGHVGTVHFASGAIAPISIEVHAFNSSYNSGNLYAKITEEIISGVRAVHLSQSGFLRVAMASVSGRMPAIGIVTDNTASGALADVHLFGEHRLESGLVDFSGYLGQPIFVGRSGHIVTQSGSFNSGGFRLHSGDILQQVGNAIFSGSAFLHVHTQYLSGGLILSGGIGSGQIGFTHLANASVASGNLASGSIGQFHLASGAVNSGHINTTGTPDGTKFLRDDFSWQTTGGGITSGSVQSGHVASGTVQGFFGTTRHVASGTLGSFDFGSGAVIAGTVGSGAIQSGNIASGSISRFKVASGSFEGFELGSGAIVSGRIASGQIGFGHLANASVQSGTLASGVVSQFHHASGSVLGDHLGSGVAARYVSPVTSGLSILSTITEESISGVRAVQFSQSGGLRIAMASVSGRMPAVGVSFDNAASGIQVNAYTDGIFIFPASGVFDYSGRVGELLYVGRSGQIVTASGSFNSGGLLSGDVVQPIGYSRNSGTAVIAVAAQLPFVPTQIFSGNVASGQLDTYHFTSGAIVTQAKECVPVFSGGPGSFVSEEAISGVRPVAFSQSGRLRIAMASVSGRMPAVGIVYTNIVSGEAATIHAVGYHQLDVNTANYSGFVGRRVWVGRSGNVVQMSGSYSSGGWASGDLGQPLGVIVNSGGVLFNVPPIVWSGGPLGIVIGQGLL